MVLVWTVDTQKILGWLWIQTARSLAQRDQKGV
jgi:hypothetical protein